MPNEFLDEIGDTLFAVAVATAIGLSAANLAIQVNKERAALDARAGSPTLSHLAHPPRLPDAKTSDVDKTLPTGLNF
jgi:hypothetical protein